MQHLLSLADFVFVMSVCHLHAFNFSIYLLLQGFPCLVSLTLRCLRVAVESFGHIAILVHTYIATFFSSERTSLIYSFHSFIHFRIYFLFILVAKYNAGFWGKIRILPHNNNYITKKRIDFLMKYFDLRMTVLYRYNDGLIRRA